MNSSEAQAIVDRLGIADHIRRIVDAAPPIPDSARPIVATFMADVARDATHKRRRGDAA